MNAVVVCYSLGGKTEKIAQELAGALRADFCRIECPKYANVEINREGGKKLLTIMPMAFSSLFGGAPEIDVECDLGGYDLVLLGFPIWAGKAAPPINTFIRQNDLKDKSFALFATVEGGGSADNAFEALRKKISSEGGEVIDQTAFEVKLTKEEKYLEEARAFAGRIESKDKQ